ncbi:DUF3106 domain-containing protein [Herbaspirillum sp. LeCh32-8]|uniref:DUF3106 domain-containing protein n=1 Tax=Herbaspirillum sp. LeCh32-8 TaxID=2821356 RepID=UPI001AE554AE|nr:DUF3106 domain-containing protein [Herbaspirillum sp. LeCh32-8]MBP0600876.1 DUF3106 domain-containing protein [Herbaspirillum sp. LeCh32-8]
MRNTTGFPIKATTRLARIALAVAALAGGLTCVWSLAQNTPAPGSAPAAAPAIVPAPQASVPAKAGVAAKATAKKPDNKLAWPNLSAPQQQALEPLSGEWAKMSELQKEKWLVISKKFAHMKPEEQQRLHDRMRDWVKLTPAQRNAARTNYARAKKLDTEEKNEQWSKYQQLSAEQKKKLAQAKLPKRVAKLPSAPANAAPTIQLPAEALDRPLQVAPTPAPAPVTAPAVAPGSQAAPQQLASPTPALAAAPVTPIPTTVADSK